MQRINFRKKDNHLSNILDKETAKKIKSIVAIASLPEKLSSRPYTKAELIKVIKQIKEMAKEILCSSPTDQSGNQKLLQNFYDDFETIEDVAESFSKKFESMKRGEAIIYATAIEKIAYTDAQAKARHRFATNLAKNGHATIFQRPKDLITTPIKVRSYIGFKTVYEFVLVKI